MKLLEMICEQENKVGKAQTDHQYLWKGEFTGFERLTDLLQYVLKQGCSSEIVLCIAKKVYGNAHILCNGEQYLDSRQVAQTKGNFNYSDSVIKNCLKAAIKLGYKDVVAVMLGGDIYHCIRLMKGKRFQEEERFGEALKMIEETVAEVMSSLVNGERQSFKDNVQRLLKEGIEIDIEKMVKKGLIAELESRGIELSRDDKKGKVEKLREKLKGEEGKVRISKTVIGVLISTLFFNYQNELRKKPFELGITFSDRSIRKKEINELNKGIDSNSFVKGRVLEKIKLLNSSSHVRNDWFFREVLSAIVNDEGRLGKLQAVCTAICKEPMQELLKDVEVYEDVIDALKLFGIEPNQTSISKKIHSEVGVPSHFLKEIKEINEALQKAKGIVREMSKWSGESSEYEILSLVKTLLSDKTPAFSGLSRKTIVGLKNKKENKKNITNSEIKELEKAVNQILGEIKQGIDVLAKDVNGEYRIDIEDIFRHFQLINREIEKKDKREIVELVCQKGNVKLLEMICRQENKIGKAEVNRQYLWEGEFTGFERLTDLLQYVLKQGCSSEIVLCIAKKVYGNAHILCNGEQYLDSRQVAQTKGNFNYSDSVIKNCLKAAIKLGYKDVVAVMLGGDIYHCIRLMKGERFQEEERFGEALKMIEETVAEVMSSLVNCKQDLSKEVKGLLEEGIEINIEKLKKQEIIGELEYRGIEVKSKTHTSKKELKKMLGSVNKILEKPYERTNEV